MKLVSLLFASFLLCLAVYPCSDGDTCVDEVQAGLAINQNDNHSHSNTEEDFCSPFCICSCCAAHIRLAYLVDASAVCLFHNTQLSTVYRERPILNNSKAIWQPPKIG